MSLYRIKISSWTSSFRYPNLISGFQPTLEVPPLSTVLGLINAAAGKYIDFYDKDFSIGYYFSFGAKATDLETIYQVESKTSRDGSLYPGDTVKSNVMNREFLFDCKLYLYLSNSEIVDYFRKPIYPLLLGRSGDLATVDEIIELELTQPTKSENIRGQIVPFINNYVAGEIQALPKYFTNSIPRNNIGTEPYSIISFKSNKAGGEHLKTYRDKIDNKDVDIYIHQLGSKINNS